jgi:hypothetical protein
MLTLCRRCSGVIDRVLEMPICPHIEHSESSDTMSAAASAESQAAPAPEDEGQKRQNAAQALNR